jgi:hypothetical protein
MIVALSHQTDVASTEVGSLPILFAGVQLAAADIPKLDM